MRSNRNRLAVAVTLCVIAVAAALLWRGASANAAPAIGFPQGDVPVYLAPAHATFTAIASDPDGEIVDYKWDFGDGNTQSGYNLTTVRRSYTKPGLYRITCTVTDDDGATATAETRMQIEADTVKPQLALECPAQDAALALPVGSEITIRLTASDNVAVKFLRIWTQYGFVADLKLPPYEYRWKVPAEGEYRFTVYAIDTSHNVSGGASFTVTGLPCKTTTMT
jgi:PKD repeat protein